MGSPLSKIRESGLGRRYGRAAAVLSAILALGGLYGLERSREFADIPRVTGVEIEGEEQAAEVELRHLADVRVGQSLFQLDLDRVVESVSRHPFVSDVAVSRGLDGVVRIRVTEYKTELLLAHRALYRVSPDGEIFAKAGSSGLDLPVLTGLDAELVERHGDVSKRVLACALEILHALNGQAGLTPEQVSEIHFDRDLGFSLILRSGSRIHMGFGEVAPRLRRLDAMVDAGLDLQVRHEVDLDLRDMAIVTPIISTVSETEPHNI